MELALRISAKCIFGMSLETLIVYGFVAFDTAFCWLIYIKRSKYPQLIVQANRAFIALS